MSKKYNCCTLFDSGYLDRGILLIESLLNVSDSIVVYALALDKKCFFILQSLEYERLIPISIDDFIDNELSNVRDNRSWVSFCWTCQASLPEYVMRKYNVENVIYTDADVIFYRSPEYLVEELLINDKSVAISPHNFPNSIYGRHFKKFCGQFCSGFIVFINNSNGYEIAKSWRNNCIEECTELPNGNSFGDQVYLEEWYRKYNEVVVLTDRAIGMAPWNIMNYCIKNGNIYDKIEKKEIEPLFYHFHGSKFVDENRVTLNIYERQGKIDDKLVELLARDYFYNVRLKKKQLIEKFGEQVFSREEYRVALTECKSVSGIKKIKKWFKNDIIYLILLYIIRKKRGPKKDIMTLE